MMEKLPEGTVIGEMRASLEWVLSHTARFAGIVVVTVQDSRGLILIDKGKPLAYYFRHGKRVLKGHNAYEYFHTQPSIQFELRRYGPDEMTKALEIVSAEDKKTPTLESAFLSGEHPVIAGGSLPADAPVPIKSDEDALREASEWQERSGNHVESGSVYDMDTENLTTAVLAQMANQTEIPEDEWSAGDEEGTGYDEEGPVTPSFATEDEVVANVGDLLLGRIIGLPGVIAVSIFKRGMNVLSIGDISLENLIDIAEDLIGSAKEVSSVMRTGPFVQMTLQIPAGNIIIAPYWDEYLCILTRPGINLGQIRKILREIPAGNNPGQVR